MKTILSDSRMPPYCLVCLSSGARPGDPGEEELCEGGGPRGGL